MVRSIIYFSTRICKRSQGILKLKLHILPMDKGTSVFYTSYDLGFKIYWLSYGGS
jgi:hypothetical protein